MPPATIHCTFCGAPFEASSGWPKTCSSCKRTSFRNPLPVAVLLLPVAVESGREPGLLMIRRAIEPASGQLALPGGYVDDGEDWRAGALRELREETGIVLDVPPGRVKIFDALSNPKGDRVLIFGLAPLVAASSLPPFRVTHETSERLVVTTPVETAFSTHTEMVARFFAERPSLPA